MRISHFSVFLHLFWFSLLFTGLLSCKGPEAGPPEDPKNIMAEYLDSETYVFDCESGRTFTVRIEGNTAILFLPDNPVRLPRIESASGAKYSDGKILFWSKGDTARIQLHSRTYRNCLENPGRSRWAHARLNGVDFRAVGNEPGWYLEITGGGETVFVTDYGQSEYHFTTPEPEVDREAGRSEYLMENNNRQMKVILEGKWCRDNATGEQFETTVTVRIDGRVFHGCGRVLN
ncbi:MAG: MliC family protein [Calditrichia bacterium]